MTPNQKIDEIPKAWRCCSCGEVMFNIHWKDGRAYRETSAPVPHYFSKDFPRVCTLCYELAHFILTCPYFRKLDKKKVRPYDTGGDFLGFGL